MSQPVQKGEATCHSQPEGEATCHEREKQQQGVHTGGALSGIQDCDRTRRLRWLKKKASAAEVCQQGGAQRSAPENSDSTARQKYAKK